MTRLWRWRGVAGVLLGVGLAGAAGCQTWIGGQTLPSPDYLKDYPDFIPKGPSFPLPNELRTMQAAPAGTISPRTGEAVPPANPSASPPPAAPDTAPAPPAAPAPGVAPGVQ